MLFNLGLIIFGEFGNVVEDDFGVNQSKFCLISYDCEEVSFDLFPFVIGPRSFCY